MATLRRSGSSKILLEEPLKKSEWYKNLISYCNKDINATRNEYFFQSPEFLTKLLGIEDKDRPIWYCLFGIGVSIIFTILITPWLVDKPWYYAAGWNMFRFVFFGLPRFVLALHFSSHVTIMKPSWLNRLYIEYFCCPFYGIPCGMYKYHHIVMHHKEDNIHPKDLSSTMTYQRDSFFQFLFYWVRFEIAIAFELPYYLFIKKYYFMCLEAIFGFVSWITLMYITYINFGGAISLWTFFVPQFLMSFLLMFGNFIQHMFVNPLDYRDDHQLTINLINTPYNQQTFNDGYHIMHHKYPTLHWSQLPKQFISDREIIKHGNANAIIFRDIDYFMMGIYVFTGNLKRLAKHFVPVSEKQSKYSVDDIVKLFKQRLIPCPKPDSVAA